MTPAPAIAAQPKGKARRGSAGTTRLRGDGTFGDGSRTTPRDERPERAEWSGKRISALQIFLGQFKSLIIWILIAAGVISGVLGEGVDAIAILAIVVLNAVIG